MNLIRSEEQLLEAADLNEELSKLFVGYSPHPATRLDDAFELAQRLAELINQQDDTKINFLLLEQVSAFGNEYEGADDARWAATFNTDAEQELEWYERKVIVEFPHSARAATPELAIARAAVSLVPLLLPYVKS